MDKTLKVGNHAEIVINTIAFGGEGIGRINDMVLFVPYTAEGDEAEVEITAIKKNYLKGKIVKILKPSPYRISPLCSYYKECGGCHYQHIRYERQIEIKEKQLRETFERVGKIDSPPLKKPVPSPDVFHYRGKAEYQIQISQGKAPSVGFINTSDYSIVNLERCEIVDESINEACNLFRKDLIEGKKRVANNRQIIWSSLPDEEGADGITDFVVSRYITRSVKGKTLVIPYGGFFQANTSLVDELVNVVEEMSAPTGKETIVDCYCGSGLFSLFLAPRAKRVFGIDKDGASIHCAKMNLGYNGFSNTKFFRGDVLAILREKFVKKRIHANIIILDPPRNGCSQNLLATLAALRPRKVVYISCNPATQARDVRYLVEQGFYLKCLQPLDMFPQTKHIEAVGLLEGS